MKSLFTKGVLFSAAFAALGMNMTTVTALETNHADIMAATQKEQDHIAVWQRYPLVGVPLITTAPTIDGAFNEREWFGAAKISRLIDYNKGQALRDRTDIYLAYTQT